MPRLPWDWRNRYKPLTAPMDPAEGGQSPLARRLIMIWLVGMLVLLPLDLIKLPLNMTLVDAWILMALPLLGLSFVRGPQIISLPYAVPMWLIFVASFVSTFAAPAPKNSFIVVLKEVYAYVWFVTLTAVLASLRARDLRRVLVVWAGVVLVHGWVIVAQFLSPDFWRLVASLADRSSAYDIYRPSGLFLNANSAAMFQLFGFVPLVLAAGASRRATIILGLLLLPTMLATGSMGASLAFTAGLTVAVGAIALSGRLFLVIKTFGRLAVAMALLGGVFFFVASHNQRYQAHFEQIFLGRAERSSGGRFDLWQRGLNAFLDHGVFIWGVGPENFREVDPKMTDNQLHNDFLAFLVERGLLGTLGLVLFAGLVVSRAAYMVLISNKYPERAPLAVVVFLGAIIAAMVESLTHQVFHFRELWMVWALQEAMLFKMTTGESEVERTTPRLNEPRGHGRGLVVQPDVRGG